MQRRIHQADCDRTALHRRQSRLNILFDIGEKLLQGRDAFRLSRAENHLPQREQGLFAVLSVEHVLDPEETDSLRAERAGDRRILGGIRIGPDAEFAELVHQRHEFLETRILSGIHGRHLAGVDVSAASVQTQNIAFLEGFLSDLQRFGGLGDIEIPCPDNAALAPSAADECRMTGHSAPCGQNSAGGAHAFHIFRIGLFPHQDAGDFPCRKLHRLFRAENDLADGSARSRGQSLDDHFRLLFGLRVQDRMQQLIQLGGGKTHHGLFFSDEFFIQHVHRHVQSGRPGAFADAALKHIELLLLNGEFNIQHVVIVFLQLVPDLEELFVDRGQEFLHRRKILVALVLRFVVQRVRRTGTCHDVLALRIDQPFPVELIASGRGIAGERNAGCGGVSHISEHHRLHVDGGSPVVRNSFNPAIRNSLLSVPALEHGENRSPELAHCVVRKLFAENLFDRFLEIRAQFFQIRHSQIGIGFVFLCLFESFQLLIQKFADSLSVLRFDSFGLFHHHVGIHHDETAVGVVDEPFIFGLFNQSGNGFGGETDVQHGLHHPGHG